MMSTFKAYLPLIAALVLYTAALGAYDNGRPLELLLNGGCEDALVVGEIPYWEEVVGMNWTQRGSNPQPYEGLSYFFAGAGASAELRQDVAVSSYAGLIDAGGQSFSFSGWVRSWEQSPADLSRVIIEYLNADKSAVLASFDSGTYSNTSSWLQITNSTIAPTGTRHIRVRLISVRRAGTNNDGYFDGLSLTIDLAQPESPQNVSISVSGGDVILNWYPVTQDLAGNPITVLYYNVYYGTEPDYPCDDEHLVGTTATTSLTLPGWTGSRERSFFTIVAVGS